MFNFINMWRYFGRRIHSTKGLEKANVKSSDSTKMMLPQKPRFRNFKSGANMEDLKNDLRVIMGIKKGSQRALNSSYDREKLNKFLVENPTQLPNRTIKDSFITGVIPLSVDEDLQEKYLSNSGDVRYGRLVEDMDIFAVMVLQKYILNPQVPITAPSPYNIITVLMDSMLLDNYKPVVNQDVRIAGHVVNVGRSSAEVVVWLEQRASNKWNSITQARFIMAARDSSNKKPAFINPLQPADSIEYQLSLTAKEGRKKLHENNERCVTKTHPTTQEQALLHQLFVENCRGCLSLPEAVPIGYKWIAETSVTSTVLSFPENRNLHNTIFGGYIMRQAIELAFSTSYLFTRQRGRLRGISQVKFNRPISVGAIIQMHAQIAFTKLHFVQIAVHTNAFNLPGGIEHATNTFQFTFEMPFLVQPVYPKSYQEAMQFIDAARHLDSVIELKNKPFHHIDYNSDNKTNK